MTSEECRAEAKALISRAATVRDPLLRRAYIKLAASWMAVASGKEEVLAQLKRLGLQL